MNTGPDTSMTAQDLLIRIAEAGGLAVYTNPDDATDNRARVPTDPHDLDRCWRALNDAVAELASRHSWACLNVRVLIALSSDGTAPAAVNGDAGVYALPWYMQDTVPASGWLVYPTGSTTRSLVAMTTLQRVRAERLASAGGGGTPQWAAAVPAAHAGGNRRRGWELHLAPVPDQAYTLECRTKISPAKMEVLGDRHVFGAKHDMTILALAKWVLHRDRKSDPETVAMLKAEAEQAIQTSIRNDGYDVEASIGDAYDPSIRYETGNSNRFGYAINGVTYID